jgi:hypothetical protein
VEYEICHSIGDGGVVLGLNCWLFIAAGCGYKALKKLSDGFIGSFGLFCLTIDTCIYSCVGLINPFFYGRCGEE